MKKMVLGIAVMLFGMSDAINIILPPSYGDWIVIAGFILCGYGFWDKHSC